MKGKPELNHPNLTEKAMKLNLKQGKRYYINLISTSDLVNAMKASTFIICEIAIHDTIDLSSI